MKSYLFFLGLFISLFFNTAINAQEDVHFCAEKHVKKQQPVGQKTLTASEENEANKYDVTFYGLDLSMSNQNTNVAGTATIHAKTVDNLDSIVLELFPTLIISDLRINGISTPYSRINSLLKIPLNAVSNYSFIVDIDYAGTPPNPSGNPFGGSGVTSTYVSTITDRVTWTVSCPFLAHEWFPCKQILRDKADSSAVSITVPSSCIAASNGLLENIVDLGNGTKRYEWKHRNPILYYLICATIAPYIEYTAYAHPTQLAGDSVMIQNFVYGNATTLPQAITQCDLLPGFLELYSDLYGLYPFHSEKYGQCVAPLGGGMEHQTMTTIGVFEKKITAHELSHSWWGDHIGIASFSDVWVSEGFATYSEYLMLENMYPSERITLLNGWHNTIMSTAGGSVWHVDTLNVNRIYNSRLTYKKGASIIHTLRHIVNNDILFFQTLQDFQLDFKDSVAVGLDVKDKFESSTGIDLTNYFNQWYFGEGYPTYSARWNSVGTNLFLEITHTSSMTAVTPTFTNPLEMSFSRFGLADTIIRFDINSNLDQYFVSNIGTVTNIVSFDPNNWVVNKVGTKINDVNFNEITGLNDVTAKQELIIYPNPTDGAISISGEFEGVAELKIVASNGAVVLYKSVYSNAVIDLSNIETGVYFVELLVKSTGEVKRTKLIRK